MHERNEFHYQIYVCHRDYKLFEYEFTLKKIDKSYYKIEKLEKRYKSELRKEEEERHKDKKGFMIFSFLNFLVRMIQGLLLSFILVFIVVLNMLKLLILIVN